MYFENDSFQWFRLLFLILFVGLLLIVLVHEIPEGIVTSRSGKLRSNVHRIHIIVNFLINVLKHRFHVLKSYEWRHKHSFDSYKYAKDKVYVLVLVFLIRIFRGVYPYQTDGYTGEQRKDSAQGDKELVVVSRFINELRSIFD